MLDYQWGDPGTIMLSTGDEHDPTQQPGQPRPIFNHYAHSININEPLVNPTGYNPETHYTPPLSDPQPHFHTHFASLYDPRAYRACYPPSLHPSIMSFEPTGSEFATRIGLNLGVRTYFSSAEDDFVNRLYRRSSPLETGFVNSPKCQAEGCNADLSLAKHYHRRHKVCEFHSKASTVIASGLTQRFCQQCSRFHLLSEFDNGKRSCRRRLADHNRRRRKSNHPNRDHNKCSSSDSIPGNSGAQSSNSVTLVASPARMSLDCFGQRSYQSSTTSSASTSSLFFSNG